MINRALNKFTDVLFSGRRGRIGLYLMVTLMTRATSLPAIETATVDERLIRLDPVTEIEPAPAFGLPDSEGVIHHLSDYRGRVVVLNFWSTWCVPCLKEMPALERNWQRIKPSGGVVLAIAMQDDPAAIDRFRKRVELSFPILLDREGEVAAEWNVIAIPTTFIIDGKGRVVYTARGIREWDNDLLIERIIDISDQ
ncbi:MAG: TlpA family protein disulfide reductase [Gammaproteobacteria bacterium]|nr:TlpA family protein disulfide reductase [Gammaproteobacteria bacterium]